MNLSELSETLREPRAVLLRWVADGMPWKPPNRRVKRFNEASCTFDPDDVAAWLEANGHYTEERHVIVGSVDEVAAYFGVTNRAVRLWRGENMPWAEGAYDLQAIAAWRDSRRTTREGAAGFTDAHSRSNYETERSRIRAAREQLELDKELGASIDVVTPIRIFTRHIAEARSHLSQLPEYALTLLPASVAPQAKRELRDGIALKINDICAVLSRALEEWAERIGRDRE